MQTSDVRRLFEYDRWANHRLLSAAQLLSPDEFARDVGASFGSIKGTLVHILDGEWVWIQFFQDRPRTKQLVPDAFPDAAAVADACPDQERELQAFADGLTDEQLQSRRTVRGTEYTLEALIQHVMNHSTYHRGQVALLLRQAGHQPPATDFRVFLNEHRGARQPGAA